MKYTILKDGITRKKNKLLSFLDLFESQIKKVGLEPMLKNVNSLCSPEALQKAVPKVRAGVDERSLTRSFDSDLLFHYCF